MYLERLLQINIATLATLGTLLLSMGQRSRLMPLLMLLSAVMSVWLTDVTRWFRLNRTVANIAGLAAVLLSLRETLQLEGEARILAIANLLIFLEIILLFQEKDERGYWQLIMLSLLQVVVATLFNQGVWFGLLLVVHMLVGLSALALLFMLRQWRRYRPTVSWPWPAPGAAGGRWPLSGLAPSFTSTPAGSGRSGIGGELFARLGKIGLGTLGLTLLVFFTVPRFGQTAWRGALVGQQRIVGFDDTVRLGDLHSAIESREPVMRIQLVDPATDTPVQVLGGLYLRGAILTQYGEAERGRWACPAGPAGPPQVLEPALAPRSVQQNIEIEPLDRPELFCVWPFVVTYPSEAIRFDARRQRLVRAREARDRFLHFQLGTSGIVDGVQVPLVPWREPGVAMPWTRWRGTVVPPQLLQLPELPRLAALAKTWDEQSGLPTQDHLGRARALESELRDSGLFTYSLSGQTRNRDIDPVEDFVSEHPQGHCEYFATALALMLRSRGIPARVVVGFRCDEWHDAGQYYQVRQLHAHTWVEAYLAPEHLPAELQQQQWRGQWSEGGWLRLDATPADGESAAGGSLWASLRQGLRRLQDLWGDYVLEMDRQRQREAIYAPVVRAVEELATRVADPDWWRGVLQGIEQWLEISPLGGAIGQWIWLMLIILVGLCAAALACWGLWWAGRRLWRRLAGRDASAAAGRAENVEFYRRLEVLLARHGLVRTAGQTQREFAAAAGLRLAAAAGQPRLAGLPCQVADAFYRVRFGRLPLDNPQAQAVEHALAELQEPIP